MATLRSITYISNVCYPLNCGQTVYLCLGSAWADRLAEDTSLEGWPFVVATIISTNAPNCNTSNKSSCGTSSNSCRKCRCNPCSCYNDCNPCNPCPPVSTCNTGKYYTYVLTVDLEQFAIDPDTGLPYDLTANDIQSIFPNLCVLGGIISHANENAAHSYMDLSLIETDEIDEWEYPPNDTILATGELNFTNVDPNKSVNAEFVISFPQGRFFFESNGFDGDSGIIVELEISINSGASWSRVGRYEKEFRCPTSDPEFKLSDRQHFTWTIQTTIASGDSFEVSARLRTDSLLDPGTGQTMIIEISDPGQISVYAVTV